MLAELREAIDALREDHEYSERQLMSYRGPDERYSGIMGAMLTTVREETQSTHWWKGPSVQQRKRFAGWWVRYRSTENAPFEFEVPLVGSPNVGRYRSNIPAEEKWTFEDFAAGGLYEYQRGGDELGPIETKEIGADQVFREFLGIVKEHLLYLPKGDG